MAQDVLANRVRHTPVEANSAQIVEGQIGYECQCAREWGERVTAVVVLNAASAISSSELTAFCRTHLAPYKTPKTILFVEQLPRNAMGKIQKEQLRKALCRDLY